MFKMLSRGKDNIRKKWDLNETSRDCNFWYEKYTGWHFPGGSVVKSLHFHCRGCRFYPTWLATHLPPPKKTKLDRINGRLDIVEERLVQVLITEAIQNETKKNFFNEKSSSDLWDNFKQSYKHWNVGIPKREGRGRIRGKYLKK